MVVSPSLKKKLDITGYNSGVARELASKCEGVPSLIPRGPRSPTMDAAAPEAPLCVRGGCGVR